MRSSPLFQRAILAAGSIAAVAFLCCSGESLESEPKDAGTDIMPDAGVDSSPLDATDARPVDPGTCRIVDGRCTGPYQCCSWYGTRYDEDAGCFTKERILLGCTATFVENDCACIPETSCFTRDAGDGGVEIVEVYPCVPNSELVPCDPALESVVFKEGLARRCK